MLFNDTDIDQVLELCSRATPGPWDFPQYGFSIDCDDHGLFHAFGSGEQVEHDMQFVCQARTLLPQLAADYRKAMEVVNAAQCRQMLINNRRELRLRNRPGEFIPELGDLIVSIGQADIRLEEALAGLERGGE